MNAGQHTGKWGYDDGLGIDKRLRANREVVEYSFGWNWLNKIKGVGNNESRL